MPMGEASELQLIPRRLGRFAYVGLGLWAVGILLPALLLATRAEPSAPTTKTVEMLVGVYGRQAASYLSQCPGPFLMAVRSSLGLGPLALLLLALGLRGNPKVGATHPTRVALWTLSLWVAVQALTFASLFCLVVLQGIGTERAWSWAWRLLLVTVLSAVAPTGIVTAVAAGVRSSGRALLVGLVAVAAVGLWGALVPTGFPLSPGQVDRALIAAPSGAQWTAATIAFAWLLVGVLGGTALHRARESRAARRKDVGNNTEDSPT